MNTNLVVAAPLLLALTACAGPEQSQAPVLGTAGPKFVVDPHWPKPLPENWILGQVAGLAVGKGDIVWIVHRPRTLLDDEKGAQATPPINKCCKPAPAVLAFDRDGNLLKSWGGPGEGYEWFKNEHGAFVDDAGNVWVGGNDNEDHQLLKFSPDGKFLQQIGKAKSTGGSNSTTQLGRPAHMVIDGGEMYIADGYGNRRIIVVDAKTGAYKRHWGAYGNTPNDDKQPAYDPKAPPREQFSNPVHCVRVSHDGLVYVCDRANNRIQVFRKDGKFVKEFFAEPQTLLQGSMWDLVLSEDPAQKYIFIADGANNQIITLMREDGRVLDTWGKSGRMAGQFKWVHNIGIDSQGNLYTAEVGYGRRVQKFKRVQ
jgi:hypothetical protein